MEKNRLTVGELKKQLNKFPDDMEIRYVDLVEDNIFPLEFDLDDPICKVGRAPTRDEFDGSPCIFHNVVYFPVSKDYEIFWEQEHIKKLHNLV